MSKPKLVRLTARLKYIAEKEDLKTESRALLGLSEISEGDIRLCLNTMQFLKRKGQILSVENLTKTHVGTKDVTRSLYAIWEQVFWQKNAARSNISTGTVRDTPEKSNKMQSEIASSYRTVIADIELNHDYEKLIQGCFENYLTIPVKDPSLSKIISCNDWMYAFDFLSTGMLKHQDAGLGVYLPYAVLSFKMNYSTLHRPIINFPKDFQIYTAMKKREETVDNFFSSMTPLIRQMYSKRTLIEELVPLILRVIVPHLQSMNPMLLGSKGEGILQRVTMIMISYGLKYIQLGNDRDGNDYRLDPPIDDVAFFSEIKLHHTLNQFTRTLCQLISHRMELERLKKADDTSSSSHDSLKRSKEELHNINNNNNNNNNNNQRLTDVNIDVKPSSAKMEKEKVMGDQKDFFGRIKTTNLQQQQQPGDIDKKPSGRKSINHKFEKTQHEIWYKYNEGFSNAVRRPVFIKALL